MSSRHLVACSMDGLQESHTTYYILHTTSEKGRAR